MALSLTDPAIQAQLDLDYQEGRVPVWSSISLDEAQAYIDYFNTLTGGENMRLITKTTYEFEIINPE